MRGMFLITTIIGFALIVLGMKNDENKMKKMGVLVCVISLIAFALTFYLE